MLVKGVEEQVSESRKEIMRKWKYCDCLDTVCVGILAVDETYGGK